MVITAEVLKRARSIIEMKAESWAQFEAHIDSLYASVTDLQVESHGHSQSYLTFRGQARASWKLQTTLERYTSKVQFLEEYYDTIHGTLHEIESASGRLWTMRSPQEIRAELSEKSSFSLINLPSYDYLVYLRHHGFPSPFLDWTRSSQIAAFFAFSDAHADQDDDIAVYAYLESTALGKIGSGSTPRITTLGPFVRTDRRHFIQQAEYTICTAIKSDGWRLTPHESALGHEAGQDILIKIRMPASLRFEVLQRLDRANLNAFSIYGTEDALMHTMALREFEFSDRIRTKALRDRISQLFGHSNLERSEDEHRGNFDFRL